MAIAEISTVLSDSLCDDEDGVEAFATGVLVLEPNKDAKGFPRREVGVDVLPDG